MWRSPARHSVRGMPTTNRLSGGSRRQRQRVMAATMIAAAMATPGCAPDLTKPDPTVHTTPARSAAPTTVVSSDVKVVAKGLRTPLGPDLPPGRDRTGDRATHRTHSLGK